MDDLIKIIESLKETGLLTDDANETVKHEIKKQEGGFLIAMIVPIATSLIAPMAYSLMQPIAYSLTNALTGKG